MSVPYPVTHYACLRDGCTATYLAHFVEKKGKTVCSWDSSWLAPKEESALVRFPHYFTKGKTDANTRKT